MCGGLGHHTSPLSKKVKSHPRKVVAAPVGVAAAVVVAVAILVLIKHQRGDSCFQANKQSECQIARFFLSICEVC